MARSCWADCTTESLLRVGRRQFCKRTRPHLRSCRSNNVQGDEVLHLPTIVDSAVASPSAAAAAATQIRKFLSKENYDRPHVQYNAVMLIRILADNPGPSFTKHMDKNFADTVKHLLRNGRDPSVGQILRESLDAMQREKAYDTNLITMFNMWNKEKQLMANAAKSFGPRTMSAPPWSGHQQSQPRASHSTPTTLPTPVELASRIEEARTSAKLLLQLVQSTPSDELLGNDLVKEFSERCTAAQRSIQGYVNCDNPAPDDDTMLTLIETNEQLSLAASKYQRAVLQARRLLSPSSSPPVPNLNQPLPPTPGVSATYTPPVQPPPRSEPPFLPPIDLGSREPSKPPTSHKDELHLPRALQAGQKSGPTAEPEDDPFADHHARNVEEDDRPANGYTPYNPGYKTTPSYLGRQESSANNLTMHGAQHPMTEEDEYARDYPTGGGPRTPEQPATRPRADSEVSPIAERAPVTYRY
jgi:hypothetical protein